MRIVTTAFVKAGHTVRFTRCATCIDAKLAAAIICAYGTSAHIPSTPNVDPNDARDIRATIARFVESSTLWRRIAAHSARRPARKRKKTYDGTSGQSSPVRLQGLV